MGAIMDALDAHNAMSTQALNSRTVRRGIKDILLNNSQLRHMVPHTVSVPV